MDHTKQRARFSSQVTPPRSLNEFIFCYMKDVNNCMWLAKGVLDRHSADCWWEQTLSVQSSLTICTECAQFPRCILSYAI